MAKNSPPSHLSPEAKRWWRAIFREYSVDDEAGRLLMQTAMEAFDRMRQAQAAIAAEGPAVQDRYGQYREHPCCAVERDSRGQMLTALKAMNLDVEPLRDGPGRPPGS